MASHKMSLYGNMWNNSKEKTNEHIYTPDNNKGKNHYGRHQLTTTTELLVLGWGETCLYIISQNKNFSPLRQFAQSVWFQ